MKFLLLLLAFSLLLTGCVDSHARVELNQVKNSLEYLEERTDAALKEKFGEDSFLCVENDGEVNCTNIDDLLHALLRNTTEIYHEAVPEIKGYTEIIFN